MGCIEIKFLQLDFCLFNMFNRNMGCIEIITAGISYERTECLIETWDVLKYAIRSSCVALGSAFNRNMGCIEMKEMKFYTRAEWV